MRFILNLILTPLLGLTSSFVCACYHPDFAPSTSATSSEGLITSSDETIHSATTIVTTNSSTSSSASTANIPSTCGNKKLDPEEECDDGEANDDNASCTSTCKLAFCGDGLVWNKMSGAELCDDGNADNTDSCTVFCKPPSCEDKILSGNETDIDCGGDCSNGCELEQNCLSKDDCHYGYECNMENKCIPPPASCKELLEQDTNLHGENGIYVIDPDGYGIGKPYEVFCDMTYDGGGWTRDTIHTFAHAESGWNKNHITSCGGFGKILGGYNVFGSNDEVFIILFLEVPHTEVRLDADFIAIDSWDGNPDTAYAKIDDEPVWIKYCQHGTNICNQLTSSNQCGNSGNSNGHDGKIGFSVLRDHNENYVKIGFASKLDEVKTNESWGVDNVAVYVR